MTKSITWAISAIFFITMPSLVAAQSCLFARNAFNDIKVLNLYAGYVSNGGHTVFSFMAEGAGIDGATERLYECAQMSSLYVGGDLRVDLGSHVTATLNADLTVPVEYDARSEDFDPAGTFVGGRSFVGSTTWGVAEGLLSYSYCRTSAALVGFRWDNWQTSLRRPKNVSPGFAVSGTADTGAITVNSYMPVVGLLASYSGFKLGVVGTPWFPGDFKFGESRNGGGSARFDSGKGKLDRGTFAEIFSDYAITDNAVGEGDVSLSLFGKVRFLEAYSNTKLTRTGNFSASDTFDFKLRRTMYVVGGNISINFRLSNL